MSFNFVNRILLSSLHGTNFIGTQLVYLKYTQLDVFFPFSTHLSHYELFPKLPFCLGQCGTRESNSRGLHFRCLFTNQSQGRLATLLLPLGYTSFASMLDWCFHLQRQRCSKELLLGRFSLSWNKILYQ